MLLYLGTMVFINCPKLVPVATYRAATMILGLVCLGLGLYSHFDSDWIKPASITVPPSTTEKHYENLYEICDDLQHQKCPSIFREHYFISIIIIAFILTPCLMLVTRLTKEKQSLGRQMNIGFHLIGGLLLLAGGILYLISTEQIQKLPFPRGHYGGQTELALPDLKRTKKLVAGSLTLIQAILFGIIAFVYKRELDVEVIN